MKYLLFTMLLGVGYSQCDMNDGQWNVLDIVTLAHCVLSSASTGEECSNGGWCDINGDGSVNVLDIVILANCVLAGNCGG